MKIKVHQIMNSHPFTKEDLDDGKHAFLIEHDLVALEGNKPFELLRNSFHYGHSGMIQKSKYMRTFVWIDVDAISPPIKSIIYATDDLSIGHKEIDYKRPKPPILFCKQATS